ncbi:N-lysine methyltransferase setd6 [Leuresthes tenuis]|uniref:N-lysine methyltransferase setd6 n=1 Tax=Leuresthes tenuis TaxID=355514 RepID=UPI003B50DD4C
MATEAKRQKVDDGSESLQDFLQWCDRVGLVLSSKVYVSKEGTAADYGMLAKDSIEEGEVLFTIPRSALLHQGTTKVSSLLEKEKLSLESSSGWVPLLLALLYEYTPSQSHWKPYLSLWSDFKALDHPMFWSKEERVKLLRGTGIPEAVDTDLSNIQREYKDVVLPFMIRHPDLWNPNTHTLDLYTQLVAFVMAYSFQEPQDEEDDEEDEEDEEEKAPNPPMMVPMADMLNHVSNHNANLEFTPESLKMVCVRHIHKGEEVFNTYGQMANCQLLHMYGFTEPYQSNSNDTADIPVINLYKAATQGVQSDSDRRLIEERWELLCQMTQDKGAFVFSKQGCLTDSELHTALKVFCMSEEEFSEFKDNEGWEDDDDEDDERISQALSSEGLLELKPSWKQLIHEAARLTLRSYGDGEEEEKVVDSDRVLMEDRAAFKGLSCRQRRALQVRFGQKMILNRLMELTKL